MGVSLSRIFLSFLVLLFTGFSSFAQDVVAPVTEEDTVQVQALAQTDTAPLADNDDGLPHYAVSLHGTPKYPKNFTHFDYVNPEAPKGGTLKQHRIGTYDSLNPFIVKGNSAAGINYIGTGLIYESLMQNGRDEPFSMYGVIAKDITIAPDKSWVRFNIREEATWHDGVPITAEDVIWTFQTLTQKGLPFFKAYWSDVESIEANGDKSVTFKFSVVGNAELPLIIAQMSVLPKHYWTAEGRNFDKTSLEPPLGSGPYKIGKIATGHSIEFVRNPDWWGKGFAFGKGMNNFDRIVYDYYRDANVAHEAFLAQNYDVKKENIAKIWYEGYTVPAAKQKALIKEEIREFVPAGMQAFTFNIRRPIFQDIKVREALAYAFDFEWSNKQFAYGSYIRTNSYFENSELAATGLPSEEELRILEPLRGKIPETVFTTPYKAPVTDGTGSLRKNLHTAITLLEEAGYTQMNKDKGRFKTNPDGSVQMLEFEILSVSASFERWILPFIKNLKRIGVKATFRVIDPAQYQRRINVFDFDMGIATFGQSSSPGNEQREYWGSDRADIEGSRNLIGIKSPVIDDIITDVIHAHSRDDLVTKTRVLDRVLLNYHYVIPMWHYPKWRLAYWNNLQRPEHLSDVDPLVAQTWWATPKTDTGAE